MTTPLESLKQIINDPQLEKEAILRVDRDRREKKISNPLDPLLKDAQELLAFYRDTDHQTEVEIIGGLYFLYNDTPDPEQKIRIGNLLLESLNRIILDEPFSRDQHLTDFRQLAQAVLPHIK